MSALPMASLPRMSAPCQSRPNASQQKRGFTRGWFSRPRTKSGSGHALAGDKPTWRQTGRARRIVPFYGAPPRPTRSIIPSRKVENAGLVSAQRGGTVMIIDLIIWLVIGGVAGWLAGLLVKGYGFGLVGNIIVGIIGALIAGWLLPLVGFVIVGGVIAAIINAVIGAVILLLVIGLFKRN